MFFNHAQKGIQLLVEQRDLMAQVGDVLFNGFHLGAHQVFPRAALRKLALNKPRKEAYNGGKDGQRPGLPPGLHRTILT
jgi:hypothetical protein